MYCVSKEEASGQWVKEHYFKTEFKAWVCARTKSKAKMCTYKVSNALTNEVASIVRHGEDFFG